MTIAANLGYPRIGPRRELKTAIEAFWAGQASEAELLSTAAALRAGARAIQKGSGIGHVPSADFALYDHVLETACAFGLIPAGYGWPGEGPVPLAGMFALARGARGSAAERAAGIPGDAVALEMTKWFDTNCHFLVPRLSAAMRPRLLDNRWARALREGLERGTRTRPVLLGPVSLLLLAKTEDGSRPLDLLPALLPAYADALRYVAEAGAAWVQIDEPCLVTDLPAGGADAYRTAFRALAEAAPGLNLLLTTYFEGLRDNLGLAAALRPSRTAAAGCARHSGGSGCWPQASPRHRRATPPARRRPCPRPTLTPPLRPGRRFWRGSRQTVSPAASPRSPATAPPAGSSPTQWDRAPSAPTQTARSPRRAAAARSTEPAASRASGGARRSACRAGLP